MNNKQPKDFIANYELNEYRYSDFWQGRQYEHQSEVLLLERLFAKYLPDLSKRTIMDLGGAYGRLAPLYESKAKQVILADYSTSELREGQENHKDSLFINKYNFFALNAYKMPLKENSLDSLLSVRVMHHIKDIDLFWEELQRVLVPGGIAIIEFANKNHILALLRNAVKGKLSSYAKEDVLQVTHKTSSQGMKEGQVSIMYNFSPTYIKRISKDRGFKIEGMFACSFLRSTLLKKLFPISLLVSIEGFLQRIFGKLLITPSVFIVLKKEGQFTEQVRVLPALLQCPLCGSAVELSEEKITCVNNHVFTQSKKGIVDLRDPRPEEIDF